MATHYIGADVDGRTTNLAVERQLRIISELVVPTTVPALRAALESIPHPRKLTFEEGPMAAWLARELRDCVDELVVCDPRRNALISQDGDSDDVIDSRKLAQLLRGRQLRAVYHNDDEQRILLKQWVEHAGSGKDKRGRLKQGHLQLAWRVNRHLKGAVMGGAWSAIRQGGNVFAEQYERLVAHAVSPTNARHTVARKLLSVMWGMWKTGTRFDPRLAGPSADGTAEGKEQPQKKQQQQPRQQQSPRQKKQPPQQRAPKLSRRSPSGGHEPSLRGRASQCVNGPGGLASSE